MLPKEPISKPKKYGKSLKKSTPYLSICAYLNCTDQPKYEMAVKREDLGQGKKYMAMLDLKLWRFYRLRISHLFFNKYLAYSKPKMTRRGKSLLTLGMFDKKLRKTLNNFFANPLNLFKRLHYQSVMIIQPVDVLDDGRQNMCDGCSSILQDHTSSPFHTVMSGHPSHIFCLPSCRKSTGWIIMIDW